jgi:endogenous inhibitor of DNA gyrase (YacG/DUF329 family)
MPKTVTCPFCGKDAHVVNGHWTDPFVECSCQTHLMRLSEVKAHDTNKELQPEE